jgi:gliding motility-associated-like protein
MKAIFTEKTDVPAETLFLISNYHPIMRIKYFYRLIAACLLVPLLAAPAKAQYVVSGGAKEPLLAVDDTPNRLQVWLVYGVEGVTVSFPSPAPPAWKKYSAKAIEAEDITAGITHNGSTSTLTGLADGYGYFAEEPGVLPRYIWIIDYSLHAFSIEKLDILGNENSCLELWLTGAANAEPLAYHTPLGLRRELTRKFELSYNTMEWTEVSRSYAVTSKTQTIEGDPLDQPFAPPLCDTEIRLGGDMFARHFGVEQSAVTPSLRAVAVEARIDTVITSSDGPNLAPQGGGYSAPLFVSFRPTANEPAASWFRWTIARNDNGDTIRAATVREMDYTFTETGSYVIRLEASDRSRQCYAVDSITISIGESYLHVPNAFTPGTSPGVNDVFKVAYKSLVSFNGWIYNRWGAEMFRWNNPAQGWDGKKGGAYVPPGVYFYVIEALGSDGRKYKEKGHINIIRSKNVRNQITD